MEDALTGLELLARRVEVPNALVDAARVGGFRVALGDFEAPGAWIDVRRVGLVTTGGFREVTAELLADVGGFTVEGLVTVGGLRVSVVDVRPELVPDRGVVGFATVGGLLVDFVEVAGFTIELRLTDGTAGLVVDVRDFDGVVDKRDVVFFAAGLACAILPSALPVLAVVGFRVGGFDVIEGAGDRDGEIGGWPASVARGGVNGGLVLAFVARGGPPVVVAPVGRGLVCDLPKGLDSAMLPPGRNGFEIVPPVGLLPTMLGGPFETPGGRCCSGD